MALAELQIQRDKAVVFSGIGCSGKTAHFININGMHVPHGRLLTYAQGAKIANPKLTVIGTAGDGDGLGIGAWTGTPEGLEQQAINIIAAVIVVSYAFGVTISLLGIMSKLWPGGIRVDPKDEDIGLDVTQHGERAYIGKEI
ncbi:MAG: thiamine pyrophosphate-dependent enzyme [Nitrosopumilus sp.]|nr:thiamine pyrophosphate-dependent enzyme [Nitrosopumilus sp.]MDH3736310.1 thiamine pyrophosphate-dependent enzyme [Nitrosopumilus sp.]MDH3823540.1 thiamine pyrophosphate-dependent enzyme [Nitrosopumilus sp.]MDH3833727.1 thiamine pyrophosphate-dependent enzyme [Nitrosopumilus sp.]